MNAPVNTGFPESQQEAVPQAFARALLLTAEARGLSIAELIEEADFPFNPLASVSEPRFISVEQYSRLCLSLFRELDDESGGIMPGQSTRFGTTRLLLHCVIRCQTLEEVLERAAEFNQCCRERSAERSAWLEPADQAGMVALNYRSDSTVDAAFGEEGTLCGLAMWLRLCSWLIGQPIDVLSAECAGPRPDSMQSLRHFFHCPISFGADHHRVCFSARHLEAPLVRNERELAAFLPLAPYHLVIKPDDCDANVTARIQRLLGEDLLEPPCFETLTRKLNMSARTLRRRLEREGTSYQRIKDNTRRDAAISMLSGTRLPVAEIAIRVGFSDPSAFHRSFKKWTGMAPGEYR